MENGVAVRRELSAAARIRQAVIRYCRRTGDTWTSRTRRTRRTIVKTVVRAIGREKRVRVLACPGEHTYS